VLGQCEAWAMVLEHQVEESLTSHIVMWVADWRRKRHPRVANQYVTAEIPFAPLRMPREKRPISSAVYATPSTDASQLQRCMQGGWPVLQALPKQFSAPDQHRLRHLSVYRRRASAGRGEFPSTPMSTSPTTYSISVDLLSRRTQRL